LNTIKSQLIRCTVERTANNGYSMLSSSEGTLNNRHYWWFWLLNLYL